MSEPFSRMEIKSAIARDRFPFPNGEKPAWRTYVNDADSPIAALPAAGGDIYPDILVVDRATVMNKYIMAAAVSTGEPSAEEMTTWRRIADAVDFFYVFVPDGHCRRAIEIAAAGKIQVNGFRCYGREGSAITVANCF